MGWVSSSFSAVSGRRPAVGLGAGRLRRGRQGPAPHPGLAPDLATAPRPAKTGVARKARAVTIFGPCASLSLAVFGRVDSSGRTFIAAPAWCSPAALRAPASRPPRMLPAAYYKAILCTVAHLHQGSWMPRGRPASLRPRRCWGSCRRGTS